MGSASSSSTERDVHPPPPFASSPAAASETKVRTGGTTDNGFHLHTCSILQLNRKWDREERQRITDMFSFSFANSAEIDWGFVEVEINSSDVANAHLAHQNGQYIGYESAVPHSSGWSDDTRCSRATGVQSAENAVEIRLDSRYRLVGRVPNFSAADENNTLLARPEPVLRDTRVEQNIGQWSDDQRVRSNPTLCIHSSILALHHLRYHRADYSRRFVRSFVLPVESKFSSRV